jgi:hypothetical protein
VTFHFIDCSPFEHLHWPVATSNEGRRASYKAKEREFDPSVPVGHTCLSPFRLVLLCEAESQVSEVEDGKVLLEQDGAEDLETLAAVALDSSEACVATDLRILDVGAVDGSHEARITNCHAEGWNISIARVDVAAGLGVH